MSEIRIYVADLAAYNSGNLDEAKQAMDENYSGCYDSLGDFVQELAEETCDCPK